MATLIAGVGLVAMLAGLAGAAQPPAEGLERVDEGWTQYDWFENENAVTWAVVYRNPNDHLWATVWTLPHYFDATGQEIQLESSYEHVTWLAPGETTAATATDLDIPSLSRVEIELLRTDWFSRDEWVAGWGPAGRFTVSDVRTSTDDLGSPVTTVTAHSRFEEDVRFLEIEAVYRDAAGDVIGGSYDFEDIVVPAGGAKTVSVVGYGMVPGVASVDVYVLQTGFRYRGEEGKGFREAGTLVPELTTNIPTPLDVSTDPTVVFANLLIAAVAMVLFTIALRILNATLAGHEGELQCAIAPARWLAAAQGRADRLVSARLGRRADAVRLAGILLFYGVVFSLLEPGWNPLTVTGIALLTYMTVAFGAVGIADDIVEWRAARRWGLAATLSIRPGLAMLAVSSTAATRIFGIVPGIMIGTPDAFPLEKEHLPPEQHGKLVKLGAIALVALGVGSWLLSIATDLVLRLDMPGWLHTGVAGLEALLLVVFAVTVQNAFMQMLALPGSVGHELERRSRWLWLAVFGGVTFLFLHTLLNPEGDVAASLKATNVRFFLGTVLAFVIGCIGIWLTFRRLDRRRASTAPRPEEEPSGTVATEELATSSIPVLSSTAPFPLPPPPRERVAAGMPPPPGPRAPAVTPASAMSAAFRHDLSYVGEEFALGSRRRAFRVEYAVWDLQTDEIMETFPGTPEGWTAAWRWFVAFEPDPEPVA